MQGNDRPVEEDATETRRRRARSSTATSFRQRGRRRRQETTQEDGAPAGAPQIPRLLRRYREEVAPRLTQEFEYRVPLQVPRLEKIVLNAGLGEALQNPNAIDTVSQMLMTISGQKPVVTRARRSIAGFKVREGMRIGLMVTLRSRRMYEFMDRLLNAALPRMRDFQGVSRSSFDGWGNYSLGIREQVIFPEIEYSRVDRIRGFQLSFVTTAQTDAEALRFLELMGMPFARR